MVGVFFTKYEYGSSVCIREELLNSCPQVLKRQVPSPPSQDDQREVKLQSQAPKYGTPVHLQNDEK